MKKTLLSILLLVTLAGCSVVSPAATATPLATQTTVPPTAFQPVENTATPLPPTPTPTPAAGITLRQVWARQVRWAKVRREGFVWLFAGEVLNGSAPVLLAAANLWLLESDRCFIICSPVPLEGFPVAPARLTAVEEYR